MTPKDIAEAILVYYLFVMCGGYELAKATLERRMTVAFLAVLAAVAVMFCLPVALVAVARV